MFWIKALANGALELVLAAFLLTGTFVANDGARLGMPALLVIDILAAAAVAVTGWRPRLGAGLAIAVAVAGVVVDQDEFGVWPMTLMCVVISLMRTRRWRLFAVTFTVVFACSVAATYRANQPRADTLWDALFTWGALDGFMLIIGLGLYASTRYATEVTLQRSRALRLQAAIDLHDLVATDLTILVTEAERARLAGGADDQTLGELAERARAAGAALRSTVGYLTAGTDSGGTPTMTFREALAAGSARLKQARLQGRVEGDLDPSLPVDVDAAAGRILAEVLFNVAQHGRKRGRWSLSAEQTEDSFDFTVTNERAARGPVVAGLGTVSVEQFARAVGGEVNQTHTTDDWTCSVTLPLVGGRP